MGILLAVLCQSRVDLTHRFRIDGRPRLYFWRPLLYLDTSRLKNLKILILIYSSFSYLVSSLAFNLLISTLLLPYPKNFRKSFTVIIIPKHKIIPWCNFRNGIGSIWICLNPSESKRILNMIYEQTTYFWIKFSFHVNSPVD